MVVIGSTKGPVLCPNLNAYMISKEDSLYSVLKIMALLRPEEPSSLKEETSLPEKSDSSPNVICGKIPYAVQDSKTASTIEIDLTNDSATWKKFETFVLNKQGQKDAWVVIQFLRDALAWLEETGLLAVIDAATNTQTVEEISHICSEFEKLSARAEKKARLAVKDLYSKWQGGEKKLQLVMRFLAAARLCMDEKFSKRNV